MSDLNDDFDADELMELADAFVTTEDRMRHETRVLDVSQASHGDGQRAVQLMRLCGAVGDAVAFDRSRLDGALLRVIAAAMAWRADSSGEVGR